MVKPLSDWQCEFRHGRTFSNLPKNSVIDVHFELPYSILSPFLPLYLSIISLFITAEVRFEKWREIAEQKKCSYVLLGTPEPFQQRIHYKVTSILSRFILLEKNPTGGQTHSDWLQFEIKSKWPPGVAQRYFIFLCFWKSTGCKVKSLLSSTD